MLMALWVDQKMLAETRKVVEEFQQAIWVCPTFAPNWTYVGQLKFFILGDVTGAGDARIGYTLNRSNSTGAYVAGLVAARESRWEDVIAPLRDAVAVTPLKALEVMDLLATESKQPEVLLEVCHGNIQQLLWAMQW